MPDIQVSVFVDADAEDLGRLLGAEWGVELAPAQVLSDLAGLPDPGGLAQDAVGRAVGAGSRHAIVRVDGELRARMLVWRVAEAEPGGFSSDVRIAAGADPAAVQALVRDQARWAARAGGRRLRTAIDDGRPEWAESLGAAGFRHEAHVVTAGRELEEGAVVPAAPDGVALVSFSELPAVDAPAAERAVHRLMIETLRDNPGHVDPVPPFEDWRGSTFGGDDFRAPWLLLAVAADRLVGLSWAVADDDPDAAYLEYTAVDAAHRGRGLGAALKAELATRLRASGIRRLITEWAVENAPIARLNEREGFRVDGGHRRLGVDLTT